MDADLARRAIVAEGWRWMPGMLAVFPGLRRIPGAAEIRLVEINDAGNALQEGGWLPDLDDDATLGCLLALVREKHGLRKGCPILVWKDYTSRVDPLWHAGWPTLIVGSGPTEAEALVAALEADRV